MKGLFDFIANYYLWILLGLVVIFFAYMGYSAEKKGYIGKKKKKDDDNLVDIDELIKPQEEKVEAPDKNKEEDLSASFDVMPEVAKKEEPKEEAKAEEEDISEDLYAPFGDQEVATPKTEEGVAEVEDKEFNQEFVDINKIETEAKDINNDENKKDVADLMKADSNIDMSFEVEGATSDMPQDNVFEEVAKQEKKSKKKKEEQVDDIWKF